MRGSDFALAIAVGCAVGCAVSGAVLKKVLARRSVSSDDAANEEGSFDVTDARSILPSRSNERGITFVLFHASWCMSCHHFKPIFEKVARASALLHPALSFKCVERKVMKNARYEFDVTYFPTVLVFRGNEQIDESIGNGGESSLVELIRKHS